VWAPIQPLRAAPAPASPPSSGVRLPRLYVVPIQPAAQDVSPLVPRRVNARLRVDLGSESSLELLVGLGRSVRARPGAIYQAGAAPAPDERAAGARAMKQGLAAYGASRYPEAQRLLLQAIRHFERSSAYLEDVDRLARAFGYLGLCFLRQRKRGLANDAIETAYALDPTLKLEKVSMPRAMRQAVVRAGRRALRRPKGSIQVVTSPEGARVFVDGDEKGKGPLTWRDVLPGRHYVSARAPGHTPRGSVVEVKPSRVMKVSLVLPSAASRLSGAKGLAPAFQAELERRLRAGLVDRRVKPLAHQLAHRLSTDFVLLGSVGRNAQGGYRTRVFLYRDLDRKLVELDTVVLDAELLNLAAGTGKISDAVAAAVARFPVARDITYVRQARVASLARTGRGGHGALVGLSPGGERGRVHSTRRPWYLRWTFWGAVIGVVVAGGLAGLGVGLYQATHQPVRGYAVGVEVR